MAIAPAKPISEEIADFLMTAPTPEQIIAFKVPEVLQKRALELLERNRQDRMTVDERAEMENFMEIEHFLTILKAKARLKLAGEE